MNQRLWIWAPAVAQMTAIFAASSLSDVPDLPGGLSGSTGHFAGYAILGALVLRGIARARWAGVSSAAAAWSVVWCSVYGLTDEFHQSFVAHRTPSVGDWVVDTIGGATGAFIVVVVARMLVARRARGGSV